jgi:hypothetical protein
MVSITSGFIASKVKSKRSLLVAYTNSMHFNFFNLSKCMNMSEGKRQSESYYMNSLPTSFHTRGETSLKRM